MTRQHKPIIDVWIRQEIPDSEPPIKDLYRESRVLKSVYTCTLYVYNMKRTCPPPQVNVYMKLRMSRVSLCADRDVCMHNTLSGTRAVSIK